MKRGFRGRILPRITECYQTEMSEANRMFEDILLRTFLFWGVVRRGVPPPPHNETLRNEMSSYGQNRDILCARLRELIERTLRFCIFCAFLMIWRLLKIWSILGGIIGKKSKKNLINDGYNVSIFFSFFKIFLKLLHLYKR